MTSGFVHELFSRTAADHPEWVAIDAQDGCVTYGELERRAAAIARILIGHGVGKGSRVVIFSDDRRRIIESMLAIQKCGAAFVPLVPPLPARRLDAMLATCEPTCAIASAAHADTEAFARAGVPVIAEEAIDAALAEVLAEAIALSTDAHVSSEPWAGDDLAYLVFTSGSTGTPKAIAGRMKGIDHFVRWETDACGLGHGTRVSQLYSPMFDAFLRDVFAPLCSGGTICLPPDRETTLDGRKLSAWLRQAGITLVHTVPSVLRVLLDYARESDEWPDLRHMLVAGEPLLPGDVKRWYGASRARLVNLYGPSETTMTKFVYVVKEVDHARQTIPVGKPMPGAKAVVVDEGGRVCPPGVVGEILIRTPYRSLGYYGQPALTSDVFIPNPFSKDPHDIVYKTGDLARMLEDGDFELLGRRDHQVKIRGVRIELGEIEAAIGRHEGVRQAVVIAREAAAGSAARLAAYVAKHADASALDLKELRRSLRGWLPAQALPDIFVALDELPLTATGKVDRARLPEPPADTSGDAERRAARDGEEEILCAIFAEVLQRDAVGIDDDFFELGGHSLLATQVASRIRRILRVEFSLRTLFELPTVAQLVGQIRLAREQADAAAAPMGRASAADRGLSYAQQRLWFISQIESESAAYNMPFAARLKGPFDTGAFERAIGEIVRRHEVFRTSFPAEEGMPVLRITPESRVDVEVLDLRGLEAAARETEVTRLAEETADTPFDLASGPMLRVRVIRVADHEHVLCVTVHHIISDAWSTTIFARELMALYDAFGQGRPSPLPELPLQYGDVTAWERSSLGERAMAAHLDYWRARLEGCPKVIDLPTDSSRPPVQSFRGGVETLSLTPQLSRELASLGRRAGASEFMVALGLANVWLSSYAAQDDIVIGTPVSNRHRLEAEGLIGLFVNTLIFRNVIDRDRPFAELLAEVRANALEAYAHQAMPFERLVDELRITRAADRNPLFQVMLNLESVAVPPLRLGGVEAEGLGTSFVRSRVDLHLGVRPRPEGLGLALIYNADLFRPATAAAMLGSFAELARLAAAAPETPVGELIGEIQRFEREDVLRRKRGRARQQIGNLYATRRSVAASGARE